MFFTREDILKIQQALLQLGVKDSELPSVESVTYDDILSIVQDGKNKQISIKDFFNQLSLWRREDFINITDKYNEPYIRLLEAINLVPILQRKDGLVITFQDTNGDWRIYQFRGNITEFLNEEKWFNLYDYRNYIVKSIVPDEEDLTASTPDKNGNSLVSLKDKIYDPTSFSGKGYKILRKNIQTIGENTKNILTQDMINRSNTIYEIRYDFDLNGKNIKIPENVILKFNGGSLCNGTLIGNNSIIQSSPITIFEYNLNIGGSWINSKTYCEWFNKDIQKTLLSFNSVNFVGNYIINKSIEISSYNKAYKIVFESGSNFSVDTSTPLDYCFIFKTYYNYNSLGSVEYAKTFLQNVITGSGNIDLKGHCGFLKQVLYDGGIPDIYNINFNIYDINIRGIGKSINTTSEYLKEGTGITVNGMFTNVGIYTNRLASNKLNQYNIPYIAVKLLGSDNKLNRVTIVTSYIGISNIAGDSVFSDVHVWGAPKIAFNVLGRSTFINCYADFAAIHYKINGLFPINIDKSIGISGNDDDINKQCILGFKNYNDLMNAKGNLSFSISGKSDNWNITGIINEDIDEIKEVSNIIPSSLKVTNIDNLNLLNTPVLTNELIPICLLDRTFPICELYLKPLDNDSTVLHMYIDLANNIVYFFNTNLNNNIFEALKDLLKFDVIEINKIRYNRLWCRKKSIKIINCFAYLYKQQDIASTSINFINIKPVNLYISHFSSIQQIKEVTEYKSTNSAYAESIPAWWDGEKWQNALGYTLAKVKGASRPILTVNDMGFVFYDTNIKKKILWNGIAWVNLDGTSLDLKKSGTTTERPINVDIGFIYKDTTLNKLILWEGTKWVNLDNTELS